METKASLQTLALTAVLVLCVRPALATSVSYQLEFTPPGVFWRYEASEPTINDEVCKITGRCHHYDFELERDS
jgi:hypothetical protein